MLPTNIAAYRKELNQCFDELDQAKLERVLVQLMRRESKIYIIGNGGSASTASHMAVDLAKGSQVEDYPSLRAISLTDNVGMITAWANDLTYEEVFTEQLKNLLTHKDVVIGISASGNSPNILSAIRYAKKRGAMTIGFAGFGGGRLKDLADIDITVSSHNYGVIEDFHLSLNHIISQFIKGFRERREVWHLF